MRRTPAARARVQRKILLDRRVDDQFPGAAAPFSDSTGTSFTPMALRPGFGAIDDGPVIGSHPWRILRFSSAANTVDDAALSGTLTLRLAPLQWSMAPAIRPTPRGEGLNPGGDRAFHGSKPVLRPRHLAHCGVAVHFP